jgi:hypothetical protein
LLSSAQGSYRTRAEHACVYAQTRRYQSAYKEATMAAQESTKKLHVYHILYRLNLSFSNIVGHCRALQEAGSVTAKSSKLFQGYVQELQAEINQELLETMHAMELDDWGTFGKIRQAEEKRLRDPDDVFIHAQERKEEIARERRKAKRKK